MGRGSTYPRSTVTLPENEKEPVVCVTETDAPRFTWHTGKAGIGILKSEIPAEKVLPLSPRIWAPVVFPLPVGALS